MKKKILYSGEVLCVKTFYTTPGGRLLNLKGKVYGYYCYGGSGSDYWPHKVETEKNMINMIHWWFRNTSFEEYFEIVPKFIDFGIDDKDFEL